MTAALAELDAHPEVDVIVIARGGGGVEDLLPFSNETLVRAVAAARTPVVSAIGHDVDTPLLDLVADLRASTPTDAAKAIVPDAVAERAAVTASRDRARRALAGRLHHERRRLVELRSRPVLTDKGAFVRSQRDVVEALRDRARRRRREPAAPRPRPHGAPARPGAHAVAAVDARPRLRDRAAGRRLGRQRPGRRSRSASCCGCACARGDFAARPVASAD